jgi:hypothetical protein
VKRDMELVKRILAEVESWPDESPRDVVVEGYKPHVVARHLEMLAAAGFLDVYVQPDPETPIRVRDLSWKGHEYFDGVGRPILRVENAPGSAVPGSPTPETPEFDM